MQLCAMPKSRIWLVQLLRKLSNIQMATLGIPENGSLMIVQKPKTGAE
jgi:hypothetical protein